MLNNLDWFGGMGFLEFLRDVGKYARMGTMLGKDSVRTRLDGDGMSFTEFTYQLLQGYACQLFPKYRWTDWYGVICWMAGCCMMCG
jgi:tyrosyl-tRNA synthetase